MLQLVNVILPLVKIGFNMNYKLYFQIRAITQKRFAIAQRWRRSVRGETLAW